MSSQIFICKGQKTQTYLRQLLFPSGNRNSDVYFRDIAYHESLISTFVQQEKKKKI